MKKVIKVFSFMLMTFLFFGVINVNATEYEDNLIKRIAPDGENAILKTVKPTSRDESDMMLTSLFDKLISEPGYLVSGYCEEEDLTNCTVSISDVREGGTFSQTYNIRVTYDEPSNLSVIDDYKSKIKTFNSNDLSTYYHVEDLGLINYYMTSVKSELWNPSAGARALKYSNEIIKLTNGSNISFSLDVRAGDQAPVYMHESAFGGMNIYYNDYCYGSTEQGVHFRRVLYIPENIEDTTEAYMVAAKARIDEYLGADNGITITYGGLLSTLVEVTEEYGTFYYTDSTVNNEDTDGNYYIFTIKGKEYRFYIMKGTAEQLTPPEYLGSELATNVRITSNNSSVPLDTSLTVKTVVNDGIKNALGTNDYKAFDIRLYSNGKGAFIETLDNGKFLVKIPFPIEYEGKKLVIYYINSNNETVKHDVTIENGFASFETNHFSTYILTPLSNVAGIENPQTGDSLLLYVALGTMSLIGLVGCRLFINKKKAFN
ncbi:MAG: hypothetical protein PHD03_04965 [Bacilli bacterium]|nr:hypothetical protein [Bacilli bacterium]